VRTIAHFRDWIRRHPDDYALAGSIAGIRAAKAAGKLAVSFDLEGSLPLLGDLAMVGLYHDLGVRQVHFAYNRNNSAAGGCHDPDIALPAFGRALVAEVNRVGMLMDCSHTGHRTSLDIMAASTRPVVFSHANPRALVDHPRNVTDEQIRACAATGGVVGINGIGLFLGDASSETVARHIDHVAQLVGAAHVGLGLDFVFASEVDDAPPGLDRGHWWPPSAGYGADFSTLTLVQPEQLPELTGILLRRGYAEADVTGILGGNFLRAAEAAWG
jgi:membrane dipeptidase